MCVQHLAVLKTAEPVPTEVEEHDVALDQYGTPSPDAATWSPDDQDS